jgi:hypothetical protein
MTTKWIVASSLTILFLAWSVPANAQNETGLIRDIRIKASAGFEYFNRTIAWDDTDETTNLKASLFTFRPALEFNQRISLAGIVGYTLSDQGSVIFREIPLSLEIVEGNTGGWLFGGELAAMLFETGDFEIGVRGEFVSYSGKETASEIPGLAVEGEMTSKPKWQRAHAGLQFTYVRYAYVYPYLRFAYDDLWGSLSVEEQIQDLTGSQERKFKSRGKFNAVLGLDYEPIDRLFITGELSILPNTSSVDWGVMARLSYVF